jgi:hypothetical protein
VRTISANSHAILAINDDTSNLISVDDHRGGIRTAFLNGYLGRLISTMTSSPLSP